MDHTRRLVHLPMFLLSFVLLPVALMSSPIRMVEKHDSFPSIGNVQSVAAVDPIHFAGSRKVRNILFTRVQIDQSDSANYPFAVVAYDINSKRLIWMKNDPSPVLNFSPYVNQQFADKLVYWGYECGSRKMLLYLVNINTGFSRPIASSIAARIDEETNEAPLTFPAIDEQGHIFCGTPAYARAISAETGKLDWETKLPWPPGPASARPYPSLPYVYFYSEMGRICKISVNDGRILWSRDLLGLRVKPDEPLREDVESSSKATMIEVNGNRIFFHLDNRVYALSDDDGRILWKTKVAEYAEPVPNQPLVWRGMIVIIVRNLGIADELKALNMKTGEIVWTWKLAQIAKSLPDQSNPIPIYNEVSSNLLVFGKDLLFCTVDGVLHALGDDNVGERWQIRLSRQSSPYADFAATLFLIDSQVVAFNGATIWWINIPPKSAKEPFFLRSPQP